MKLKIILFAVILAAAAIPLVSSQHGRRTVEVGVPIEDVELLRYEPIDLEKLLAKPETMKIPTERDPFYSPYRDIKGAGIASATSHAVIGADSVKLTGIIKGPNGYNALIKSVSDKRSHAVKQGDILGPLQIIEIADNIVVLTINGVRAVLKLGGDKK